MQLPYVKCSPGGNITVLFYGQVPVQWKAPLAGQIMAMQTDVEQVGFIEQPHDARAAVRLEMSGGEFCGNAARCCAWLHSLGRGINPGKVENNFFLEVSGAGRLLKAAVNDDRVCVEMPVISDASFLNRDEAYTIVPLEGITHVVVPGESPNNCREQARELLGSLGLMRQEAAGVIYYQMRATGPQITPVVWVRDISTLVAETACASGTISVVLALAAGREDGVTEYEILQPSGSFIRAKVTLQDGLFFDATIEGPVEFLDEGSLEFS